MAAVQLNSGEELVVEVLDDDNCLLARTPVRAADLCLARDETWREGMRTGVLSPRPPSEFHLDILPGRWSSGGIKGFTLRLHESGRNYGRKFSVYTLAPVARRTIAELRAQDRLPRSAQYRYRLNGVGPAARPESPQQVGDSPLGSTLPAANVRKRTESVVGGEAPLHEFYAGSQLMPRPTSPLETETDDPPMPAFISAAVWDQAFQLARRGGRRESAAVLTGRLLRDTESPEIFLVVDACIEAEYADQSEASVTFSGETWARVREVLALRRKRLRSPAERMIGVVHGHNFLPGADEDGNRMCSRCPEVAHCNQTTAVASQADLEWFAAVFSGQPWALSLIHGYTAREEDDWRLYHLADGTLAPRTIRRLER